MRFSLTLPLLAALGNMAIATPAAAPLDVSAASDESHLAKRFTGDLKAWTGTGSKCSGTPGFTWNNPGGGCIHFVGGGNQVQTVHRLAWSGQNCVLLAYASENCPSGEAPAYISGTNSCLITAARSFKVSC